MVCGRSNRNISFNQIHIFGYFNSLLPCLSFCLTFLLSAFFLLANLNHLIKKVIFILTMIHPKPIWNSHSVDIWFLSTFISNYVLFNQSKISNMELPPMFTLVWNADTQISEGNASHDDVSKVKQSALSAFEKNSPPSF